MSTGASREALVDNESLGKSRQVGGDGKSCAKHLLKISVLVAILEYELLASWWARLSTGASREAPVDNECLDKSRQVGGSGDCHTSCKQICGNSASDNACRIIQRRYYLPKKDQG